MVSRRFPDLLGRSRHLYLFAAALLAVSLTLTACSDDGTSNATASSQPPAPPPMPVSVVTASATKIPITVEAIGQAEGAREIEVHARVKGLIEKRLYDEGSTVLAKQPLFQIERTPFEIALEQAKASLAEHVVRVAQSKHEVERLKALAAQNAVSKREYDDAKFAAQLAEVNQRAAEARVREAELNLSYTLVTAPAAGISGRALQSEGNLIGGNNESLLTTIKQIDPIWVRFSLSEQEYGSVRKRQLVDNLPADVDLVLSDGTVYGQKGKLNFAGTEIDRTLGTVQLRAEFPNPQQELIPGQFVRARLIIGERDNVFLLPQVAVLQGEQGHFVYVADAKNTATIRPVQTGEWSGANWVILSGLQSGDKIIVDNLLKLRPGAAVIPTAGPASPPPAAH